MTVGVMNVVSAVSADVCSTPKTRRESGDRVAQCRQPDIAPFLACVDSLIIELLTGVPNCSNRRPREDMRKLLLTVTFAAALAGMDSAAAQNWPSRPVTIVVPFAAGGAVDVVGRILAPRLSELLDRPVIIDNVGGAGGMTGTSRVAKAAPDGYQVVLGNSGTHAYNQTLYKTPLYNSATDFAPVALIGEQPIVLTARKDFPARTLPEFIAYTKANQARMQFGSAGVGSTNHLGCVLLNAAIGVNVTHIPYRGGGPAMQDLIAGRLDYACNVFSTALPQILARLGNIRPILLGRAL